MQVVTRAGLFNGAQGQNVEFPMVYNSSLQQCIKTSAYELTSKTYVADTGRKRIIFHSR